jgi:hypothetical protein
MAIDKNFVVKNGLEVNDILIHADPVTKRVGFGTDLPEYQLDVRAIPKPGEPVVGIATTTVAIFRGDVIIQGNLDVANDEINLNYGDITNIIGDTIAYNIGTITNFNSNRILSGFTSSVNLSAGFGTITNLYATQIQASNSNFTNIVAINGNISRLEGSNLNYGIGTITSFNSSNANIGIVTGNELYYNIGTITNLYSTNGDISNLTSPNGTITNLGGTDLNYINGTIENFNSSVGIISTLSGIAITYVNANFENIVSIAATITDINTDFAFIKILEGEQLRYNIGTFGVQGSGFAGGQLKVFTPLYDKNNVYGNYGQYLKSTGPDGVEWESFGVLRNRQVFTATEGQTVFAFQYDWRSSWNRYRNKSRGSLS